MSWNQRSADRCVVKAAKSVSPRTCNAATRNDGRVPDGDFSRKKVGRSGIIKDVGEGVLLAYGPMLERGERHSLPPTPHLTAYSMLYATGPGPLTVKSRLACARKVCDNG